MAEKNVHNAVFCWKISYEKHLYLHQCCGEERDGFNKGIEFFLLHPNMITSD